MGWDGIGVVMISSKLVVIVCKLSESREAGQ